MSGSGAPGALPAARLIVAMTESRLMGREGGLPWHLPEDLAHFKRNTLGNTCVMGRRSWESLGGRALPKRTNVVISRSAPSSGGDPVAHQGALWFRSLPQASRWIGEHRPDGEPRPWILGGAELFRQVLAPLDDDPAHAARLGLPRPEQLLVTWVPELPLLPGDVLFPYDRAWIEGHYAAVEQRHSADGTLEFVTYSLRR